MHICLVSEDYEPASTGVGVHLQTLIQTLISEGHHIIVITTRKAGQASISQHPQLVIYRVWSQKILGFYQGFVRVNRIKYLLKLHKIDVIHIHYVGFLMMQTLRAAKKYSVPVVYTFHMLAEHINHPFPFRWMKQKIAQFYASLCNQCHLILVPSRPLIHYCQSMGIQRPIQFLRNPIEFAEETSESGEQQEEFSNNELNGSNLNLPKWNILYVGRLDPEKNIPLLLRAVQKLNYLIPNLCLQIVGTGTQVDFLKQEAERLGLNSKVEWLGYKSHSSLPIYYKACQVFVLPSLFETQGMVVVEAMRFAKPVIVTDQIVSATELVTDGSNGFIVNAFDENQLVEKVTWLHAHPDLAQSLGLRGKLLSEEYNKNLIIKELLKIYRGFLGHKENM